MANRTHWTDNQPGLPNRGAKPTWRSWVRTRPRGVCAVFLDLLVLTQSRIRSLCLVPLLHSVTGRYTASGTWQPTRQRIPTARSISNRHVMHDFPGPRVRMAIVSFVLSFLAFSADAAVAHSHIGEACENECGSKGPCSPFCGTAGKCCRIGEVGLGCDGTEGTSTTQATCTPNPASAAVVCDGGRPGSFGQQVRTRVRVVARGGRSSARVGGGQY